MLKCLKRLGGGHGGGDGAAVAPAAEVTHEVTRVNGGLTRDSPLASVRPPSPPPRRARARLSSARRPC